MKLFSTENINFHSGMEMKLARRFRNWLSCFVLVWLLCGVSLAQSAVNSDAADDVSGKAPASTGQQDATQPAAVPGSVIGTVLDPNGSPTPGVAVRLTKENSSFSQEVSSGDRGEFTFSNVPPGAFKLTVSAEGFGRQQISGELDSGQVNLLPPIVISVATVVTALNVHLDPVEVATEEVKEQELQRVLRVFPNFYVSYKPDAAPLTTKLKFELAWKSTTDPVTILGTAFLSGLQQAGDQYSEFGQGVEGYGKRFGANYVDIFASTFLSGALFPSILKQDPRYYYQGTGSTRSRLLHAIENSVKCKGDNGQRQYNYSNIAGIVAGAALSSTVYPTNNVGTFIVSSSAIRMGESSLTGVFQEFVLSKLTNRR